MYNNLDDLTEAAINELNTEEVTKTLSNTGTTGEAREETCLKILAQIGKECSSQDAEAKPGQVLFVTAYLLQKGATSPKTPGATKYMVGNISVTVEMIRKACRQERVTVRQFARGIKDKIISIMNNLGEQAPEGNLARSMRLDLTSVTAEEAIWASDFQTYNPNCPTRVRNWLVKNYRSRFRNNPQN